MKGDVSIPYRVVSANLKCPKADGIACPDVAGYNDYIMRKERRLCFDVQLHQQKHQRRPQEDMVIVAEYELIENIEKGVFC